MGAAGAVARVGRGTQALQVQTDDNGDVTDATAGQENAGAAAPSIDDAITQAASTDAVAVTGQEGQINGLAGFSQDDLQNRIQDMQRQGMTNGDICLLYTSRCV